MLDRKTSLAVGIGTVAMVYGVYNSCLPSIVDARAAGPSDRVLSGAEHTAAWTATAVVAAVSLLSKDPTVFILGGAAIVTLSWLHKHANMFDAAVGSSVVPSSAAVMSGAQLDAAYAPAGA